MLKHLNTFAGRWSRKLAPCFLLPVGLMTFMLLAGAMPARGQDDAAALWKYYPPLQTAATEDGRARPGYRPTAIRESVAEAMPEYASESLAGRSSDYGGFNSRLDPLFDLETRPSWTPPTIEKPMIERPTYDYPGYDAPLYGLEPVRKAVIERPAYEIPVGNRPNYNIQYDEGPAEIAPTLAAPAYEPPNYVVKPYQPPAVNAPVIDRSAIGYHPEGYNGPVYKPDEYRPPRELPPEYLPPPE
jgi:hypothetical protein